MAAGPSLPGRRWLLCIGALSILAFAAPANGGSGRARLVVATTCDLHGAIEAETAGSPGAQVAGGGAVALSGYVGALRDEFGDRLLLLDAGDLFVGSLASRASQGAAVVDAYNLMGYAAAALGNHEFDFGRPVLAERMRQARFPFLAANVDVAPAGAGGRAAAAGQPWAQVRAGVLVERAGVRVGLVGAATPQTPATTQPRQVDGLAFLPPAPRVLAEAERLRRAGADLVVLVAHMGGACRRHDDPDDLADACQPLADSELFSLVAALPPGTVDVAVGGHTHQEVAHWLGNTAVLQAGSRGQHLVWMEAAVRGGGGVDRPASRVHPPQAICLTTWGDGRCRGRPPGGAAARPVPASFRGRRVRPDPAVVAAMRPYLDDVTRLSRAPAGCRLPARIAPEGLCEVAAAGMRRRAGADFALQNTGGFRIPLGPGDIDRGTLYEAMPFDNALVVATLTGAQLQALADHMHSHPTHHQMAPFCLSGLRRRASGALVQVGEAGDAGMPLAAGAHYRLATNAFVAQGGEGSAPVFAGLAAGAVVPAPAGVAEALADELSRRYPTAGRARADGARP